MRWCSRRKIRFARFEHPQSTNRPSSVKTVTTRRRYVSGGRHRFTWVSPGRKSRTMSRISADGGPFTGRPWHLVPGAADTRSLKVSRRHRRGNQWSRRRESEEGSGLSNRRGGVVASARCGSSRPGPPPRANEQQPILRLSAWHLYTRSVDSQPGGLGESRRLRKSHLDAMDGTAWRSIARG